MIEITLLLLVHVTCICVLLFANIPFVANRTFNATSTERLLRRPLLFAVNAPIAHSFCECCTWHHLHILFKAPLCCDWKLESPGGKYAKLHTCIKQR